MDRISIFTATLGLAPPWRVTSACFTDHSNRLDIRIEYALETVACPRCGSKLSRSPSGTVQEIWYHRDFLSYATYLHARIPIIPCRCGAFPLERPWCRAGSGFMPIPALES